MAQISHWQSEAAGPRETLYKKQGFLRKHYGCGTKPGLPGFSVSAFSFSSPSSVSCVAFCKRFASGLGVPGVPGARQSDCPEFRPFLTRTNLRLNERRPGLPLHWLRSVATFRLHKIQNHHALSIQSSSLLPSSVHFHAGPRRPVRNRFCIGWCELGWSRSTVSLETTIACTYFDQFRAIVAQVAWASSVPPKASRRSASIRV